MTKKEVRDEHRMKEGDPMVRGAPWARQPAAARNRMMADVPQADVVLVNPVHVVVALRYEADRGTPRVVAKGAGAVAARIREPREQPGAAGRGRAARPGPARRLRGRPGDPAGAVPRGRPGAGVRAQPPGAARGGRHRSPRTASMLPALTRGRRRRGPPGSGRRELSGAPAPGLWTLRQDGSLDAPGTVPVQVNR